MNNYLSVNLVNGRLGRLAGGSKPTFILNEQNEVQLYVLDFPKPSTYPTSSLSDAYASEIIPRDFSSQAVRINAGVRGANLILSTDSFFNLPTNISTEVNSNVFIFPIFSDLPVGRIRYDSNFSIQPTPLNASIFSITITLSSGPISKSATTINFSFDNSLNEIKKIITDTLSLCSSQFIFSVQTGGGSSGEIVAEMYQVSDYSYSFTATQSYTSIEFIYGTPILNFTINNINASASPGKYGYLDFSSPSWNSVIGTKKETPIWMEAMIGSDTIAQGNAILCRKMT